MSSNKDKSITLRFYPDELVTAELAAKITNRSEPELRQRRMYGAAPEYVKAGKRAVRYRISDLVQFLTNHEGEN